jgi:hypothetical protein
VTLPELRHTLAGVAPATAEDARLRDIFVGRLDAWPGDPSTTERLLDDLNRILGQVWFSTSGVHSQVFEAICAFSKTVAGIGGMTLNERLFNFGLLDAWDASSAEEQKRLRIKLGAA